MNMEPVEMVSWQGLHPHFGGIPRWSHLLHVGWGAPAAIHAARNSLVPSWVVSSTLWKSLRKMTSSVPWQHGPGCLLIPISRWSQRLKQRRRSRSYSPFFHQQSVVLAVVLAVVCCFMSRIYYRFMTHRGLIGRVTEPLCHHGMEEPNHSEVQNIVKTSGKPSLKSFLTGKEDHGKPLENWNPWKSIQRIPTDSNHHLPQSLLSQIPRNVATVATSRCARQGDAFGWSLGLVSRMLVRTINEGSTLVMSLVSKGGVGCVGEIKLWGSQCLKPTLCESVT